MQTLRPLPSGWQYWPRGWKKVARHLRQSEDGTWWIKIPWSDVAQAPPKYHDQIMIFAPQPSDEYERDEAKLVLEALEPTGRRLLGDLLRAIEDRYRELEPEMYAENGWGPDEAMGWLYWAWQDKSVGFRAFHVMPRSTRREP